MPLVIPLASKPRTIPLSPATSRGHGAASAPRLLPAGPGGRRHAVGSLAQPSRRALAAAQRPSAPPRCTRHRTSAPTPLAGLTPRPPGAAGAHDATSTTAPPPRRPDAMPPTQRRPCASDPARLCGPHAGGAARDGGRTHRPRVATACRPARSRPAVASTACGERVGADAQGQARPPRSADDQRASVA